MNKVISKKELLYEIGKFIRDEKRGISIELFCDLCGVSKSNFLDVFRDELYPISEYMQRRVSKGFTSWKNGEVSVMQNRDRTRFVQYRKEPKPTYVRSTQLQLVNGEFKIKIGIKNRADYSDRPLTEKLDRR